MKQKDVTLILVIAFISAIISFFISNSLFASSKNRSQLVDVAPSISPTFPQPNTTYFNINSVDPAQLIQVGNNNNTNPFNGSSQ